MSNFAYYRIDGRNVNRVTSILKATENPESKKRLQAWKKRVGAAESERRSKEATERGTALHSLCESYLRGQEVVCLNDVALPYWYSIKGELANITDVIALETQVYHDTYNYAGSFDCFGTYNGVKRLFYPMCSLCWGVSARLWLSGESSGGDRCIARSSMSKVCANKG